MRVFRFFCVVLCAIFLVSTTAFAQSSTQFSPNQVKQIQQIVHDYLVQNPQVLIEASIALRKQQATASRKQTASAISANKQQIFDVAGLPFTGNAKGKIIMVEFFDYRCPHCQLMIPVVENLLKANPKIKIVFADWPIFGGTSVVAAKAAVASMLQGKYYAFHNALLAQAEKLAMQQKPLLEDNIYAVATSLGLDVNKLKTDMKSAKVKKLLARVNTKARTIKVVGTPAFLIINKQTGQYKYYDGQTSASVLQKLIDAVK